jgi:hypothetical protein
VIHLLRRVITRTAVVCGLLVFVLGLSGCGEGLPDNIRQAAGSLSAAVKTAENVISQEQEKYKAVQGSDKFAPVAPFAKKENWPSKFADADQTLNRARDLIEKQLTPLIKKNKPETAEQVRQQIERIQSEIQAAEELSRYPMKRFALISTAIVDAPAIGDKALQQAGRIRDIIADFEQSSFNKALKDFPDNRAGIASRMAPLRAIEQEVDSSAQVIQTQFAAHKSNADADYAAFADSAQAIEHSFKDVKTIEQKARQQLDQLYQSYTKILKDMKVVYHVTVMRESWNENSDYYDPVQTRFTREVPEDVYDAVTADNIDSIGEITAGFSGSRFSSKVGDAWNKLGIKPGENWPSRQHNAAEFWVEDDSEQYFHKYILENNGETSETQWQQVDESIYDANLEYLGMAILAKPYGTFEQDRLTQAAPPGMAYVGNPQYGEWKEDSSGDRFWSWYGKYAFFSNLFFFPPFYYGYHSWYGWHNNYRYTKPYFGKTKQGFNRFGTYGTAVRQSPTFQNTAFAKSGGFKSQASSVRGAGSELRGGGPKGKGK